MKSWKNSKVHRSRVRRWIAGHKKLTCILFVLIVVILVIAGFVFINSDKPHSTRGTVNSPDAATLHIESNIPGISMSGSSYCGFKESNKQTPYGCKLPDGQTETVITAPSDANVDGKTYAFQTWDGCSESNEDKKICKVKVSLGENKEIKATYKTSSDTKSSSANISPVACPAPSKYIVAGPQSFMPGQPGQLVLYNKAKDFQQPSYAQFWSGNSCKEIPLTVALRATRQEGGPSQGFGLADSAFVTRTSVRTTVPAGGHIYIAVVDTPTSNYQALGAVIRDDGTVMIEKAGLKKTLDPSGTNTDANGVWAFKGWVDSHTALFRIPWTISSNSNCYSFDFDANTYASADSNLCSW